jgi:hypothetical protein
MCVPRYILCSRCKLFGRTRALRCTKMTGLIINRLMLWNGTQHITLTQSQHSRHWALLTPPPQNPLFLQQSYRTSQGHSSRLTKPTVQQSSLHTAAFTLTKHNEYKGFPILMSSIPDDGGKESLRNVGNSFHTGMAWLFTWDDFIVNQFA